jgi:protein-tyrosine phosphatase
LSSFPNCSFVEIHTHVLYGLDDGAKSFEESVAMLEMAASGGTTDIVGTPHSDLTYSFQPELIAERVNELRAATGTRIRLHHGCDFHLHFDNIQDCLEHPSKYTINHKRYLLVEFDNFQISASTSDLLKRIVDKDLTPIITHPERNPILRKRVEEMAGWVRNGCLVQVTAQSFLDRFGKSARQASDELMERGMVHFVASDAHGTEDRTPLLGEAFAYVVDRYGADRATALFCDNPRATLTGEYLDVEDPCPAKKKRWFW